MSIFKRKPKVKFSIDVTPQGFIINGNPSVDDVNLLIGSLIRQSIVQAPAGKIKNNVQKYFRNIVDLAIYDDNTINELYVFSGLKPESIVNLISALTTRKSELDALITRYSLSDYIKLEKCLCEYRKVNDYLRFLGGYRR